MIEISYTDKGMFQENTYFVLDSETNDCLIIDPGYYDYNIRTSIPDTANVKYIIATHAHQDHIDALDSYKRVFPNAQFMYCEADNVIYDGTPADRYISDGDEISFGNTTIKVIGTPGHTPGGISLLIDDMLFSGDTLFLMSVGRTDLPGGDWAKLQDSVRNKLFVLPDSTKVFPGHGEQTSIGYEKKANPFV